MLIESEKQLILYETAAVAADANNYAMVISQAQEHAPCRRPMSPKNETRKVGSPRAESSGRVVAERDEYWTSHSVLSRMYIVMIDLMRPICCR